MQYDLITEDFDFGDLYKEETDPSGRLLAGIAGSNPADGMDVCCEFCVLFGIGVCDGPITRPEESYRVWCV
jgi:hypothetical protein